MMKNNKILLSVLIVFIINLAFISCNNENKTIQSQSPIPTETIKNKNYELINTCIEKINFNLGEMNKINDFYNDRLAESKKTNQPYAVVVTNVSKMIYDGAFNGYKTEVQENNKYLSENLTTKETDVMLKKLSDINNEYLSIEKGIMDGFSSYSDDKYNEFKQKYSQLRAEIDSISNQNKE